jgi:hypothetical protein
MFINVGVLCKIIWHEWPLMTTQVSDNQFMYLNPFMGPKYCLDQIDFPSNSTPLNLRSLPAGCYGLVLAYLQQLWQDDISLVADINMDHKNGNTTFDGLVRSYSHIKLKSL